MAEINADNVMALFQRITGEMRDTAYADLVDRSVAEINRSLKVTELDSEQAGRCEYAAACEAVYQYALEGASAECFVMSEDGGVRKGSTGKLTLEGADALRKKARGEISDVAEYGGFVFEPFGG